MSAWKNVDVPLDVGALNALVEGRHEFPRDFLGPQLLGKDDGKSICPCLVRAYFPEADDVWIHNSSGTVEQQMKRVTDSGLFEVICEKNVFETDAGRYKFEIHQGEAIKMMNDPYAYGSMLTELDLYLFNEGNHYEI